MHFTAISRVGKNFDKKGIEKILNLVKSELFLKTWERKHMAKLGMGYRFEPEFSLDLTEEG